VAQGDNISALIRLLDDDGAVSYVVPVLYNICVDYGMQYSLPLDLPLGKFVWRKKG
jgi:hypothetical protein